MIFRLFLWIWKASFFSVKNKVMSYMKLKYVVLTIFLIFCGFIGGYVTAKNYQSVTDIEVAYIRQSTFLINPIADAYKLLEVNEGLDSVPKNDVICFVLMVRDPLQGIRRRFIKYADESEMVEDMLAMHQFYIDKINDFLPDGVSPEKYKKNNCAIYEEHVEPQE